MHQPSYANMEKLRKVEPTPYLDTRTQMQVTAYLIISVFLIIAFVAVFLWRGQARRLKLQKELTEKEIAKLFFDHYMRTKKLADFSHRQMAQDWQEDTEWKSHFTFLRYDGLRVTLAPAYPDGEKSVEWHNNFRKYARDRSVSVGNISYPFAIGASEQASDTNSP
jgi:hypothetical protein